MSRSERVARILVTGGSGFLGINLVRHLLELGHDVRTVDLEPFDYPEADRVEHRIGDVRDAATMDAVTRGVHHVVHAAAALPLRPAAEIRSTEVDGTSCVLAAALRHDVERVVFISSTAVYGVPDHHPLRETDPTRGVGPYGESKIAAETLCRAARDEGLTVSILRPKSFIGPERLGIFALLYEFAADGRHFPVLGPGTQPFQLLDVEDLCRIIVACLTCEAREAGATYNVGAAEFDCPRRDFQAVLDAAGFGRRVIPIPRAPAVLALRLLERLGLSPVYEWVYESASRESHVSIERAIDRLGFRPRFSNREALLRNFEWYLAHRDEFAARSGTTHRVPFRLGLLALIKRFF